MQKRMKGDHTQWLYVSTNESCPRGTIKKMRTHTQKVFIYIWEGIIKQMLTIHIFFLFLFLKRWETLRVGYIWAIIKAYLFLLHVSFSLLCVDDCTNIMIYGHKFFLFIFLPWLPARLLIIIPNFSFFFWFLYKYFCWLIKIFVTLWELVMIFYYYMCAAWVATSESQVAECKLWNEKFIALFSSVSRKTSRRDFENQFKRLMIYHTNFHLCLLFVFHLAVEKNKNIHCSP